MANTLTAAQINLIYQADLGRAATSAESGAWFSLDSSGTLNDSQVIAGIVNSVEAQFSGWQVVRMYQSAFGRIPDQAGYSVNTHAIDTFPAPNAIQELQIAADFVLSAEFIGKFGNLVVNNVQLTTFTAPSQMAIFIQALYLNVLGRTGAGSEVNGWLATGDTAAQILIGFSDSLEFQGKANPALAALLTTNAIDAIATPPTTALTGTGALLAPAVQTFNLTINADSFAATVGGAVFNALPFASTFGTLVNTLNAGDNLQDTVGDGTLNLIDVATSAFLAANPPFAPGVTMNGIKTINFTNNAPGTGGFGAGGAGFQGTVTGLTTVVDTASIGNLTLGAVGQGIDATGTATANLLNSVTVAGFAGPAGSIMFDAFIAAAAGNAANAIAFTLSGVLGTTAAADVISVATDGANGTAAAPNLSYGKQTYTVNSTANLQLQAEVGTGPSVDGTTAFVFKGSGNTAIGQDAIGDHQKVTSIDASGTTGSFYVTGGTAGVGSNALSSPANPGGAFGSAAGFLNDATGFALATFNLGTGVDTLDVSSATAAQVGALTTTPAGTTAATNEIIVASAVADTTTATTFANIKGFSILGDAGAAGTINLAFLPSTINDIFYQTASAGAVVINNQTIALTVDTESNGGAGITVGTVGPAPGLADAFTLIVGDTVTTTPGAAGPVTLTGDEIVTITSQGAAGNTVGSVLLTPSLTGNEQVTIGGNQTITVGGPAGAVADVNGAGALTANNLTMIISDTKAVTLGGATAGALFFTPPGDPTGALSFPLTESTNAVSINAATSGGLLMQGGDANYTTAGTVAGSVGDVITGATGAGNVLAGSVGNDTFVGNTTTTKADTVVTNGGADTIGFTAGHTVADHVDFFSGSSAAGAVAAGGDAIPRPQSVAFFTDAPQIGYWGLATGAVPTGYAGTVYAGLAANTGTSLDQSVVTNFLPGTVTAPLDVLDFGANLGPGHVAGFGTWDFAGTNGNAGITHGLTFADLFTGTTGAGGGVAVLQQVNPGTALVPNVAVGTNILQLTTGTFANANAVVGALHGGGYTINFTAGGALGANDSEHVLVAYQDLSGNAHVMDLAITDTAAVAVATVLSTAAATVTLHGSDMIQVSGQALLALNAANYHFT